MIRGSGTLLDAVTADTDGTAQEWLGGKGTFTVFGTFGSGTCKLQRSLDNGTTWIDVSGASFTANGEVNFEAGPAQVRAVLSGSTSPALTAKVAGYE